MEEYILEAMKYFTVEEWTKLDGSEQLNYGQILYIYHACIHLGIRVVPPHFMSKQEYLEGEIPIENNKGVNKCDRFDYIKEQYTCQEFTYNTNYSDVSKQEKQYICPFCSKPFSQKESLKRHIIVIHSKKEKDLKCEKCTYKTKHKSSLKRHMKTHSDIKPFVCETCNEGFNTKRDLNDHSSEHNNEDKPFKCRQCSKSYSENGHLTRHVNAIHLKNKMFKCDECEYSTAIKSHLKRHAYTHLNKKPFECSICGHQCCTSQNLTMHLKNKHGY